jgi:hypothetical protein
MFMRWIIFICVLSMSISFSSCDLLYITSKTYDRYVHEAPYDVIIVPGVPYDSGGASGLFKARMYWAKQLYDQGTARNIIFSGGAVRTPYIESIAMKLYANALGIPPYRTFVEIRATHSNENIFYGLRMARQLGFKKVALATDPIQSFLYRLFSKVYPTELGYLPLSMDSMQKYATEKPDICIDEQNAFVADFNPPAHIQTIRKSFGRMPRNTIADETFDTKMRSVADHWLDDE